MNERYEGLKIVYTKDESEYTKFFSPDGAIVFRGTLKG